MTTWADPIEKVTALITRPGLHGPELLVFDHPRGDVQLPAGTVEPGEPFADAAMREAWEETGALGLEMVGEVAALPMQHAGDRAEDRRVFHLRSTVEMPDEWWVVTPDGGGMTWHCRWLPLDDARDQLGAWHAEWLDAARPSLDTTRDAPPRARVPLPPGLGDFPTWETFLAPPRGARRFAIGLDERGDLERCRRAHGLCVTDDGSVVLVCDADGHWDHPGGGKEPEETTVDTFVREVAEEACATVTAVAGVAVLHIVELDAQGAPASTIDRHAQLWARVELDPWDPQFETTGRRLVTPDEAVAETAHPFLTSWLLDRALLIDPALDWKPGPEDAR